MYDSTDNAIDSNLENMKSSKKKYLNCIWDFMDRSKSKDI